MSQKMADAWNVPPSEEGEGGGRNVPHWQLNGRALGVRWEEVCTAPQHGLPLSLSPPPSLLLSTSGEGFAPLWRIQKDSLWTEATGAKNTLALVAQQCLVFAIAVQIVLIFLHFL